MYTFIGHPFILDMQVYALENEMNTPDPIPWWPGWDLLHCLAEYPLPRCIHDYWLHKVDEDHPVGKKVLSNVHNLCSYYPNMHADYCP